MSIGNQAYAAGSFLTAEAVGGSESLSFSTDGGVRVVTVKTLVRPGYALYHKAPPKLA